MVKEKHVYYNLLTGCQLLFKFSSQSSLFQMKTILPPRSRIDDLEKNIADLMTQAGVDDGRA
jgi:hypothetical protein